MFITKKVDGVDIGDTVYLRKPRRFSFGRKEKVNYNTNDCFVIKDIWITESPYSEEDDEEVCKITDEAGRSFIVPVYFVTPQPGSNLYKLHRKLWIAFFVILVFIWLTVI